mmetsp:Transcript_25172/g.83096  ORF Transcript_25172/g.83096 Transcript_25172/m.83096 type:complete len:97 (+) Transcript_25172:687-977(+)
MGRQEDKRLMEREARSRNGWTSLLCTQTPTTLLFNLHPRSCLAPPFPLKQPLAVFSFPVGDHTLGGNFGRKSYEGRREEQRDRDASTMTGTSRRPR